MVIDSLLQIAQSQSADALIIMPDAPPRLEKSGESTALSMPPLGNEMTAMALEDLTNAEQRAELQRARSLQVEYDLEGTSYAVTLEEREGGYRIVFRRAGGPAAPAPEPDIAPPIPAAPPRPTAPPATPVELDPILARAAREDASDIFVSCGREVRLRIGGAIVAVPGSAATDQAIRELLGDSLDAAAKNALEKSGSADLALDRGDLRYRVNLFQQRGGLAAALRPIRRKPPTLRELSLPEELVRLTQHRHGLVLMTGTAGSGKSTTLTALIERINRTSAHHVITLEDPIEYEYEPVRALIHQREVGRHVESFSAGLRAALRESPDVILVGEMRDAETIAAAMTAAETGHLVLSTMHCGHAAMAIDRIIDVFPEYQQGQVRVQLASVLRAVVTQMLIPSTQPPLRVPAFEKLVVTTAVATKIREARGHTLQSEIQTGRAEGMVPLEVSLANLVRSGRLDIETAKAYAGDGAALSQLLR